MKTKDMALMQKRADFKRLLLANHLAVHGLERLEASYDALIASDYAKLPCFNQTCPRWKSYSRRSTRRGW